MRILTWNMGAAMSFRGEKHAQAWTWLNEQDVDVALLQETVPPENLGSWGSAAFQHKYPGKDWGCAVLVREGAYEQWKPEDTMPWLGRVGGAVAVARPAQAPGLWFASVHSDSSSFESTNKRYPTMYTDLPPRDGILRCNEKEMWQIEVIAHELQPVLAGTTFVFGGDLNSSLLFGDPSEPRLFANLAAQGFTDLRNRHSAEEQQTFFKAGRRPFQLDHVYSDAATEARCVSWQVLTDVAADLKLSDHAPILVELDVP